MSQHHSWSCDLYLIESEYQNEQVIGDPAWIVNDWTGHIKAMSGRRFVRAVRGTTTYGINDFVDNGDSTVTDNATGLMWSQNDNREMIYWKEALEYAENAAIAGYNDWRLPNIKELQSIADYSVTEIPVLDSDVFNLTEVTNIVDGTIEQPNYPFYWSSTSNPIEGVDDDQEGGTIYAWALASGYNVDMIGYDLHGAGSVIFRSKTEENSGIEDSVPIMVRLVRDADSQSSGLGYNIIDTGQEECYNTDGEVITAPAPGEAFYGQDAQFEGTAFSFEADGEVVTDLNTGLIWQQVPSSQDFTWQQAVDYCENLELGGYDDWRMPSLKELFSISNFSTGWPYLDLDYFSLASGVITRDEQFWSKNYYVGTTVEGSSNAAFGVNHVTGHIKAYPANASGPVGGKYVRAVRGEEYGINDFSDNYDGTITDNATGLMWAQDDDSLALDWENALAYAENSELAGYSDWYLPDVKELQGIVDYSYSPSASIAENIGPAINPIFNCTPRVNEAGNDDYGYYWTNTSARFQSGTPYYYAWYVAFGMAVDGGGNDSHGAGAVRFDTKVEGGPLGEGGERYYNFVRLVRDTRAATGIDDSQTGASAVPDEFELKQNYPNPFNPSTTISFSLSAANKVTLKIYNVSGQLVATLVESQLSQGNHSYQWQAENISSGIYFYRLSSSTYSSTKRMLLLK